MKELILLVVFQDLLNEVAHNGAAKVLYELKKKLDSKKVSNAFFFGTVTGKKHDSVHDLGIFYRVVSKVLYGVMRRVGINVALIRTTIEVLFDLILLFKLVVFFRKYKFVKYITTNSWQPFSTMYLKAQGADVILLAGNPNDNVIREVVVKEKLRLGIKEFDPFDLPIRNLIFNKTLKHIDEIIAINELIGSSFSSQKERNTVRQFFGVFPSDTMECQMSKKEINNSKIVFGFIGHTTILKGLHNLLETWQNNCLNNKSLELIIVGAIHSSVAKVIDQYRDINNCKFLGNIDSPSKKKFFENTDVIIIPSLIDASPVTLIEAFNYGKPVLVSDGVGNSWLVQHKVNGYFYSLADKEGIKDGISFFLENYKKIPEMGANAKKTLLEMEELNTVDKILEILLK